MGDFSNFEEHHEPLAKEELRVNPKKGTVQLRAAAYKYKDADTGQHVIYMPSLEMSGYGETKEKAAEMLKFSMDEYCEYITNLSADKLQVELSRLGWKKNAFRNKEFSKAYVNTDGVLQGLNAVDNKVEQVTLVAS